MEKLHPTVGVFGGVFDDDGNLLLRKREEKTFFGDWELPGGAIYLEHALLCKDERLIREALALRIEAEVGIPQEIILEKVQPMPAMYPVVLAGGADIAFAIIVGKIKQAPTKGITRFVCFDELINLADGPEGNRIVSGRKRMFRMCLRMFASRDCPSAYHRLHAGKLLQLMHK